MSTSSTLKKSNNQIATILAQIKLSDYAIKSKDLEKGKKLGRGGFADVFRGTWKTINGTKLVALKCFENLELEADAIQKELKLHLILNHPHILKCYGFTHLEDEATIVLELSEYGALDKWIYNKKNCDPESIEHADRVLDWFQQCAAGLHYLHSQDTPIIHRDFKPQNILLFNSGKTVKISDMGVSRTESSQSMTNMTGTLFYLSPEALSTTHYDQKSDIYSYGISLSEVLTCRKPFSNNSEVTGNPILLHRALMDEQRPGPLPTEPKDVVTLISNCWKSNPEERPSITEVLEEIKDMKIQRMRVKKLEKIKTKLKDMVTNTIFISKKVPEFAKFLIRLNTVCNFLVKLPFAELSGIKALGFGMVQVASIFNKISDEELAGNLSEEDLDFVNSLSEVRISSRDLEQQQMDGLSDLREEFNSFKDKHNMMNQIHSFPGSERILKAVESLLDSVNLDDWAQHFQTNKRVFSRQCRGDFSQANLTPFFKKIYEEKCKDSLQPLEEMFVHIWNCRAMYFTIICTYFQHKPGSLPALELADLMEHELRLLQDDYKVLEDVLETICEGFFMAGLTRDRSWPLGLAYLPKLAEIPKNDDTFWKESTVGDVMFGYASGNPAKVKLYRNKNSEFVRVHNIENNDEYIHVIDDNGQLSNGIHRYLDHKMDTWIGSRYFIRGDRKEDRAYRLYRFNKSGNIIYDDKIQGKGEDWRVLTQYEYKPESLSWEKDE